MWRATFQIGQLNEATLTACLTALVSIDLDYLRRNPSTPSLYSSGVRYSPNDRQEIWQDVGELLKTRLGDCEDLASWRVAELLASGTPARPLLVRNLDDNGSPLWHIMVKLANGSEDPSKRLGMVT